MIRSRHSSLSIPSMNGTLARQLGLAGATGLLYPLCFPNFDLGALAWVLLVPLHLAVRSVGVGRAFWLGWLSGLVAFVGTMSWVVTAMHQYGRMPLALSYPIMVLLTAYLGLYVAAYAVLYAWFHRRLPAWLFLAAPSAWVTLELVRTYLLSGLPWSLLGYSQYRWLSAIQIADLTGVYGVSFVVVLVNVAITELGLWARQSLRARAMEPAPWLPVAATALVLVLTLSYGVLRLQALEVAHGQGADGMDHSLRIGLVQANIDQAHKWDPAYTRETLERYRRLTERAAKDSDLVIWPEAATPFIFEHEEGYRQEVISVVRSHGVPLLLGSPAVGYEPDGRPYFLNSAYLLSSEGHTIGRYDKQHLVPFGEYVPLRPILFFLDKLVVGIGDFKPGRRPTILQVPQRPPSKPVKFGVVICYEVIFPDLVRQFAAGGAEFMVTITNDAWFGKSAAPFQHFGMVVLRSVENRVAFARAANTGVSGYIDPAGRIVTATDIYEQAALRGDVRAERLSTFYTRFGDVFAYGCVIMTVILCAVASRRRQG